MNKKRRFKAKRFRKMVKHYRYLYIGDTYPKKMAREQAKLMMRPLKDIYSYDLPF